MPQSRVGATAVDVIDPKHIGKEHSIETAALQGCREIEPIRQAVIFRGAVARMRPQSRRLMRHAVHGEGVEPDFLWHDCARFFSLGTGLVSGALAEIVAFRAT